MQSFNDSQRSKPQFQEQFRHANNESDVSDEDMGLDVDENVVRAPSSRMPMTSEKTKFGGQIAMSHHKVEDVPQRMESSVGPTV